MADDSIDGESTSATVVACPHCGQRNRLVRRDGDAKYRCGACKTEIGPSPKDGRFTVLTDGRTFCGTQEEVLEALGNGKLSGNDVIHLATADGGGEWVPLRDWVVRYGLVVQHPLTLSQRIRISVAPVKSVAIWTLRIAILAVGAGIALLVVFYALRLGAIVWEKAVLLALALIRFAYPIFGGLSGVSIIFCVCLAPFAFYKKARPYLAWAYLCSGVLCLTAAAIAFAGIALGYASSSETAPTNSLEPVYLVFFAVRHGGGLILDIVVLFLFGCGWLWVGEALAGAHPEKTERDSPQSRS